MLARRPDTQSAARACPTSESDVGVPRSPNITRLLSASAALAVTLIGTCVPAAEAVVSGRGTSHPTRTRDLRSAPLARASVPAPVLKVLGPTLKWTPIHRVRKYTLATVHSPRTTRGTTYRVVTGTSFTPPAVRGETVRYALRADVRNAPWSSEVTIASGAIAKLRIAVMNTTGWYVDSIFRHIGVTWTRIDVGTGVGTRVLTAAVRDGMRPLPVYASGPGGSLAGSRPAQCASDISALAARLRPLGITEIEFGNEVYRYEDAAEYAAQYNAAHAALAGTGIKLLADATTESYESDRGGSGSWFHDMIQALPGGAGEIDALTLHPYGSMTDVAGDGYGWPMIAPIHAEAIAAGISPTLPWYITEAGQEISGKGLEGQPPVSESVQAADLTDYLNDIKTKYPWIVFFSWYSSRDDSSGGFGLLNRDNSPRPAFTALANWMSANAGITNG
jgi:hypothetical protein